MPAVSISDNNLPTSPACGMMPRSIARSYSADRADGDHARARAAGRLRRFELHHHQPIPKTVAPAIARSRALDAS
jgi:hypothetical protein